MNESFVFYRSFGEALEELPAEQYKQIMTAVSHYALDGEEPELDGVCRAIFLLIKPQIDANERKRANGRKGGEANQSKHEANVKQTEANMKQTEANAKQVEANANANVNANEELKEKVSKETEKKSPRFSPPSIEEVTEYCRERGNKIDPQQFLDFYASKGWKVGLAPMKDWKACVRTWEKRETARSGTPKRNSFTSYQQRNYDLEALEAAITV